MRAERRHAAPGWRGLIILWALAALACQSVLADDPTPVQPIGHPPQPATASPAPATPLPATATPDALQLIDPTATPGRVNASTAPPPPGANYQVESGDTLTALALRFRTDPNTILAQDPNLPPQGTLAPGTWLNLPTDNVPANAFATRLLPDSEVVFAPAALSFDLKGFVLSQPGYLATYSEVVTNTQPAEAGWQIVADFARTYSVNPRVLLALLELQSHALTDPTPDPALLQHPLNVVGPSMLPGLSHQLGWASNQLNYGFYGWQAGSVLTFGQADGGLVSGDGRLNAGSFAVARLLGLLYKRADFAAVTGPQGFQAIYQKLFGAAALTADPPLIPGGLTQPEFQLPFEPGTAWAFSGGPHPGYGTTLPWGALDFAPPAEKPGCAQSPEWDVAVHAGQVVYSRDGLVELDVGGGWTVVYLHVATLDRAPVGTVVKAGDRLGHPSCEGGEATGSHLHISRRYNGEWLAADGFAPFVMSGWTAHATGTPYKGTLTKGDLTITSCSCAIANTRLQLP